MALLSNITCDTCQQSKEVWHSPNDFPTTCSSCEAEKADAKLQAHLDELSALPIDQRLRRIETWIYHHSMNHPQREMRF